MDDEADFASIRFTKSRDSGDIEQGRIADRIDELRRLLVKPAVLQVTATPYSLYLQPDEYESLPGANFTFEPKRPAFTVLVPVHSGYVGGDEYFGEHDETQPEHYLWHEVDVNELLVLKKEDRRRVRSEQVLTSDKISGIRHAIITFVCAAAIRRLFQAETGDTQKRYAMIVHVETARHSHAWQHTVANEIIEAMGKASQASLPIFDSLVDAALDDLKRSLVAIGQQMPGKARIVGEVRKAFQRNAVVTERVNSDNDIESLLDENAELRLRTPYNVFIGGQILDRGITVPNLISFYYGRSPKRMQQDTVLQHARMYGNRPKADLAVTRFFTTAHNYMALKSIHEFDSALRYAFDRGAHDRGVAFVVKDSTNRVTPCAPSKVLASDVVALRPGGTYLPFGFQTISRTAMLKSLNQLDRLFVGDFTSPKKIPVTLAIEAVDLIESTFEFEAGYSFDWEACRAAIEYFSRIAAPESEQGNCYLYAQVGRTLSRVRAEGRYSDSPHTYQDRTAVRLVGGNLPVLGLFRQEGFASDGWRDANFWWPVLFAPTNAKPSIFASTVRNLPVEADDDDD